VNQGVNIYSVACDYTKEKMMRLGIEADRVFVTGIPTDEKFIFNPDKKEIRQTLKVNPDLFTVLIATGSFGMGPIQELIQVLSGHQLLIVCGHNKKLFESLKSKANNKVHVFGLVNNMHELMSAADVMVTKPGGLSIAEALVKKLPLIFFSAIPGQETGNINVLVKYQAAAEQGSMIDIVERVDDLSFSPEHYHQLRQKLEVLSKPNAVKDIIKLL
jgi:processive 1,2-diacylglycerol beta-glucosyltransferase